MNILALRDAYADLFYPNQDWFLDEEFAHVEAERVVELPLRVFPMRSATPDDALVSAATLTQLYVFTPTAACFRGWLWTRDVDRHGQRVFVGGTKYGRLFQIHRHIKPDHTWGIPSWD